MDSTIKSNPTAPIGASTNAGKSDVVGSIQHRSQSAKNAAMLRKQRDQLFEEAAKGMVPEHRRREPEDPLKHWWPQINRKLREGYSVRQVHEMTCAPQINLGLSLRTFHRLVKQHGAAQPSTKNQVPGTKRAAEL